MVVYLLHIWWDPIQLQLRAAVKAGDREEFLLGIGGSERKQVKGSQCTQAVERTVVRGAGLPTTTELDKEQI